MAALTKSEAKLTIKLDELQANDLPDSLQEIVKLIGLPAALKLVDAWGGIRIFVPRKISEDHAIAQKIGIEAANKLRKYFDGSDYPVPNCKAALMLARDRQIRRMYGPYTAAELALSFDLTERQIYRIVAETETNHNQIGLDF